MSMADSNQKRCYVVPSTKVVLMMEDESVLAGSGPGEGGSGWTTSDKQHGQGIKEEDKDNPYDDGSYGAKGNFDMDWE